MSLLETRDLNVDDNIDNKAIQNNIKLLEADNEKELKNIIKKTDRKIFPNDTIININGRKFGGGFFQVIAGPCAVESREQILDASFEIKKCGVGLLRGGAYKPRSSPYAFQGLREDGIKFLVEAKKITGIPIVTEILRIDSIHLFESVDVIQVGMRNMQNYELLKELGKLNKPILLKRGMANTIDELLMSAEYIMSGGNEKIILCERGIRSFETSTRNILDISAIPVLKKKTHLPVIVDPSHAAGMRDIVEPLTMAAIAAGADGVMIEIHKKPYEALCDGFQSLNFKMFEDLIRKVDKTIEFFGKKYSSI